MDVRTQLDDINWELSLFLRNLSQYRENVNVADSTTIKLLSDTLETIDQFISDHNPIPEKGTEKSLKFVIDENKFEISRFVTCRICCLQIPFGRTEYLNHVTSDYHNRKLIQQEKLSESDQSPHSSSSQSTASKNHATNGHSLEPNGNNATKSNKIDAPAIKPTEAKNNSSWRDREQVSAMPAGLEYPPNTSMNFQPQFPNYGFAHQKMGQPLYPPNHHVMNPQMNPWAMQQPHWPPPLQQRMPIVPPYQLPHNQPNIMKVNRNVAQEPAKLLPNPMAALKALLTGSKANQKVETEPVKAQTKPVPVPSSSTSKSDLNQKSGLESVKEQMEPAATVSKTQSDLNRKTEVESAKSQPKPVATAEQPLSSVESKLIQKSVQETAKPQPKPVASSAPKVSPDMPPDVFSEDIFEFIDSQGTSTKHTESLPAINKPDDKTTKIANATTSAEIKRTESANKPDEKNKKIVNASTSAEIKPSKPYELQSMYSKFSHLKPSGANASVPIATKPVTVKPTQSNSSQSKPSNADDLQIHKFLAKAAQKPNQPQSNKPSNELRSQNRNASQDNATNVSRPATTHSAGLSGKLKQMFDEINKLKSKAELEEIQASRGLQRSSSIISLPTARAAKEAKNRHESVAFRRSTHAQAPSHKNVRGRSLSNSNFVDTSKGAIPKQRISPNTNNNNVNDVRRAEKQRAVIARFFARDLTPCLSRLMESAVKISTLPLNKTIAEEIELLLRPKYPTVKCNLIGSRVYGIAKESSAFDIYLDLHDSFHQDKTGKVYIDGIVNAEELFAQSSNWSDPTCSEQTRYGILSVMHKATKIKCRMIFGTGVPVRNTKVIQCLFDAQPLCRQLVICIQLAMLEVQNPLLQRFKNGYTAAMLVLFYFQKQGLLPSVKSLQDACASKMKCGENAVEFQKPKDTPICSDRFLDVLVSFFKFYYEFEYAENIISVFHGNEINHNIRNISDHKLDPSLLRFKHFIQAETHKWPSHGLCVQDIFMHKRNVTVNMTGADLGTFRSFCKDALDALRSVGSSVRY